MGMSNVNNKLRLHSRVLFLEIMSSCAVVLPHDPAASTAARSLNPGISLSCLSSWAVHASTVAVLQ